MGFISASILDILGMAFSIVGLAFIIPICFVFRQYFRFNTHMQFLYLFYIAFAPTAAIFSSYAEISWASIAQNFYIFCTTGDLVCTLGFQLSYTSCLVVSILLALIITKIVACKKPQARFQPVYRFMKGLIIWTYVPLVYYSLYFLIQGILGINTYIIESAVVFGVCVIFPFCQLIGYKCIQVENQLIWPKWLQFLYYMELLLVASLAAIDQGTGNMIPRYFIYGIIVVHTILFSIKHKFSYKIFGRILFILGECCLITIFSMFLFQVTYIVDFHLDLFLVAAVLLLDMIYYIAEIVYYCKNGVPKDTDSQRINPEDSEADRQIKKKNSYNVELEDVDNEFNDKKKYRDSSYDELNASRASGNLNSSKVAKTRRKR